MKQFLKIVCFYSLLVVVVANGLSYIALKLHANGSFYKPAFLVNTKQPTHYDYIVIGASTGLTTLNTQLIDSLTGKKGINLAMDDTNISSNYLMLQHFLAQGNTSDLCILAPGISSYNDENTTVSNNDYRFAMFAGEPYVKEYFQNIEKKNMTSKLLSNAHYFPLGVEAYYNAELLFTSAYVAFDSKKRNRFDVNGNYTYPFKKNTIDIEKKPLEIKFRNPYIHKLNFLCKNNNMELLYFISPIANKTVKLNRNENIIDYSNLIDNTDYFYDAIHVNSKGRKLVSEKIASDVFGSY